MRRLLLLLPLLLFAADAPQEIEGWTNPKGQWSYDAKSGEICGAGTIESVAGSVSDFEMTFQICIDECTDAYNMAGISFRANETGARYKLSLRPDRVTLDKSWVEGEKPNLKCLASQPMSIPKGQWIPIILSVRGGKMEARIGRKTTLQAVDPEPLPPAKLELITFRATARFKIKKLKTK
ncbi:MAG: hypothetical protein AB1696_28745 [Planctomycetota bacterium]